MDNLKLPAYFELHEKEMREGNNAIADFMPNMIWIIPKNTEYAPYWRKLDKDGLPIKDYKAGIDLTYHYYWNDLKPVIDRIFTYSLAFPEETSPIRKMSIVVDIIPAWKACVKFALFAKAVLEEVNK